LTGGPQHRLAMAIQEYVAVAPPSRFMASVMKAAKSVDMLLTVPLLHRKRRSQATALKFGAAG